MMWGVGAGCWIRVMTCSPCSPTDSVDRRIVRDNVLLINMLHPPLSSHTLWHITAPTRPIKRSIYWLLLWQAAWTKQPESFSVSSIVSMIWNSSGPQNQTRLPRDVHFEIFTVFTVSTVYHISSVSFFPLTLSLFYSVHFENFMDKVFTVYHTMMVLTWHLFSPLDLVFFYSVVIKSLCRH
jgi:hypothetical protein